MIIDFKTVIPTLVTLWILIKKWIDDYSKVIDPLIAEAEKLAQDGVIDKNDRKKLVWCAIQNLEKQGKVKLNFITRIIAMKLVDYFAQKLPDYKISQEAKNLISCQDDKKPA